MNEDDTPPAPRQIIERYLAEVTGELGGRRSSRRDVADELRDHLMETVATAENEAGVEAAHAAVRSLGAPADVAARFQPGLSRTHARGIALGLLLTAVCLSAVWLVVLALGPHSPWPERVEPQDLAFTDVAASIGMALSGAAALVAVVATWLIPRFARRTDLVPAAGRFAAGACWLGFAMLASSVGMIIAYALLRGHAAPHSIEWSDVFVGATLSFAALLGQYVAIKRVRTERSVLA